ncbi:MAG: cytochrome d ubiquinol oxidase subunit II [Chloroflexi bacterium]|nr:cytochrome d ubiquinol oxidase subunit II [Chloroflexota bacterium]
MDLPTVWFVLIGVLIAGYVVLDGFDLGAGILHLFVARTDRERRTVLNSIGPVWDGNEVWLLPAGGALFAAFPIVYATVFSGFYLALIVLLLALIIRAVSLEFRSREASPAWRRAWDTAFAISSFLPALLLGVAIGNVVRGLPMEASGDYTGGLLGLLNPFSLTVGLLSVALLTAHGGAWLAIKTTGDVQARAKVAARWAWLAALVVWGVAGGIRFLEVGELEVGSLAIGLVFLVATVGFRLLLGRPGREATAFLASALSLIALIGLVGSVLYPNMVPALGEPSRSLTIAGAASSELTLSVMLVIALIGMPLVIAYTAVIYWHFRGKTAVDEEHGY